MSDNKKTPVCGNPKCGVSTFIDEETLTFGSGHLDELGVWEHGCEKCARAWKKNHPKAYVMWDDSPTAEDEKKRDAEFGRFSNADEKEC